MLQVATRRTRTAGKVEIPNVDDHVSKLEHMGKETVKKLQDIRTAAVQAGVEINVPDNCILKGELFFRARAVQRIEDKSSLAGQSIPAVKGEYSVAANCAVQVSSPLEIFM